MGKQTRQGRKFRAARLNVENLEVRLALSDVEPNDTIEAAVITGLTAQSPGIYSDTGTLTADIANSTGANTDERDFYAFSVDSGGTFNVNIADISEKRAPSDIFELKIYVNGVFRYVDYTFSGRTGLPTFTARTGDTYQVEINSDFVIVDPARTYQLTIATTRGTGPAPIDIAMTSATIANGFITYAYRTSGSPGSFGVGLYQSSDQRLDSGDRLLTGRTINPPANSSGEGSFPLSSISPDPFRPFLLIVADAPTASSPRGQVAESDETNNTASARWLPFDIELESAKAAAGSPEINVVYETTSNPGQFGISIYRSRDLTYDETDTLIASKTVSPQASSTGALQFVVAPQEVPSQPYLIVVADPLKVVVEPDETNNVTPVRFREFDRTPFFQKYRSEFNQRLTASQVRGLNQILDFMEADSQLTNLRWIAYMLATVRTETSNFLPIVESRALWTKHDKPGDYGELVSTPDGNNKVRYYGRGYVQLTHKRNYLRIGRILGFGESLANDPDSVLQPATAYNIMSYGMRYGTFTGLSLARYINENFNDRSYYYARQIINGLDRAQDTASSAQRFERMIRVTMSTF